MEDATRRDVDDDTNPQSPAPGAVRPERTPGSAPSVVPLPSGADPDAAPGEHPLPEDAIDGYPRVAEMYEGSGGSADGAEPTPDPVPARPSHGTTEEAAQQSPAAGSGSGKASTSSSGKK